MAVNQDVLSIYDKWMRSISLRPILVACAWLIMWRAAALMEYEPHVSVWFPPSGVTFAIFLVLGWSYLPVLILCSVAATFWENSIYGANQSVTTLVSTGLLFAAIHSFAYWLGAALLKQISAEQDTVKVPNLILLFLILAVCSSLVAAIGGSTALVMTGIIDYSDIMQLWVPWWVGDLIGVVVITPLIVSILGKFYPSEGRWLIKHFKPLLDDLPLKPFIYKLITAGLILLSISMLVAAYPSSQIVFMVFFLGIAQMWIVFTETASRSFISLAVLSTLTAVLVDVLGLSERAMVYQFTIYLLAVNTYFGLWVPHILVDNQKLRRLSEQDILTDVQTRQFFIRNVHDEVVRARRYNQPISMILFDIDKFKVINDNYGHIIGDKVLIAIANLVKQEIRPSDKIGRFGGDEFMLLLPGDDLPGALQVAERLCEAIGKLRVHGMSDIVTCSFGVTEIKDNDNFVSAFEQADKLLLEAKKEGRHRVKS